MVTPLPHTHTHTQLQEGSILCEVVSDIEEFQRQVRSENKVCVQLVLTQKWWPPPPHTHTHTHTHNKLQGGGTIVWSKFTFCDLVKLHVGFSSLPTGMEDERERVRQVVIVLQWPLKMVCSCLNATQHCSGMCSCRYKIAEMVVQYSRKETLGNFFCQANIDF